MKGPLTVVILIDALGWEIVRHFRFCESLLQNAAPLETVLGYSSAAIPTLLTGTPPETHGAWAMYRYAPATSPFKALRILPRLPHALEWRTRRFTRWLTDRRNVIKGYYDLYDIPVSVLGYFDVAEHGDPYTPGSLTQETLFDRLHAESLPFRVWTYRTPERDNVEGVVRAVSDGEDSLLFWYTADLDALMHRVGVCHADVSAKLAQYEADVARIVDTARSAGRDLQLFLFSDHGMTDVVGTVDLMAEVERWGYRVGSGFMAFYDSTMARFWCPPSERERLAERLNETGWGSVLTEKELASHGCRFKGAYGDVIFLAAPGTLIVPSYMGREAIAAMHGYHPDDAFSKGCFMTNVDAELPHAIIELKEYLHQHITGVTAT